MGKKKKTNTTCLTGPVKQRKAHPILSHRRFWEPEVGYKGCWRNIFKSKGFLSGKSMTAQEAESTGKLKSLLLCWAHHYFSHRPWPSCSACLREKRVKKQKQVHVTAIRFTGRPLVNVSRPDALRDCPVAITATWTSFLQLPLLLTDLLRGFFPCRAGISLSRSDSKMILQHDVK